jgi:hypothetical protein
MQGGRPKKTPHICGVLEPEVSLEDASKALNVSRRSSTSAKEAAEMLKVGIAK